jgi:uncharacterized protein with von Willebrand factor type A (vWA) domain
MKDLGERQREMRERMKREVHRKGDDAPATAMPDRNMAAGTGSTDVLQLRKRLAAVEAENAHLRSEIEILRRQKRFTSNGRSLPTTRGENSSTTISSTAMQSVGSCYLLIGPPRKPARWRNGR